MRCWLQLLAQHNLFGTLSLRLLVEAYSSIQSVDQYEPGKDRCQPQRITIYARRPVVAGLPFAKFRERMRWPSNRRKYIIIFFPRARSNMRSRCSKGGAARGGREELVRLSTLLPHKMKQKAEKQLVYCSGLRLIGSLHTAYRRLVSLHVEWKFSFT